MRLDDICNKKPMKAKRFLIEEHAKKWEENPIVERLEDSPIPGITKKEHIKELQEILVQTCLDYINQHGLTDIYSVSFNADELAYSAKHGKWHPVTDSYIRVEGSRIQNYRRKDGEITQIPYTFVIGESM